jgi:hypothetical protein
MNARQTQPHELYDPLACSLCSAFLSSLAVLCWVSGTMLGVILSYHLFPLGAAMAVRSLGASVENRLAAVKAAPAGAKE